MSTRFFYDLTFWPIFFYLAWPIFELDWDIVKMIILSKFDEVWTKTLASKVFTRFFYDLTYWPSFWPNMIHIRSWPSLMKIGPKLWSLKCSQGFSMIWPSWPNFWPNMIHIRSWPSLMKIGPKLWPLECSQGFFMIWLLTKFLTWDNPYSILTKLEEDWTKTVASRVFKRFFYDLTYWPSFDLGWSIFDLDQVQWRLDKYCGI